MILRFYYVTLKFCRLLQSRNISVMDRHVEEKLHFSFCPVNLSLWKQAYLSCLIVHISSCPLQILVSHMLRCIA